MDERYTELIKLSEELQRDILFFHINDLIAYVNYEKHITELPVQIREMARNRQGAYDVIKKYNDKVKDAIAIQKKYESEGLKISIDMFSRFLSFDEK